MKLFVYVLNQPEKLEEVLAAFVEIGITGATVVDSVGMGRIIAQDVPIFASFQSLLSASRPYNKTILSVIDLYTTDHPDRGLVLKNVPRYAEIIAKGTGAFLKDPTAADSKTVYYE